MFKKILHILIYIFAFIGFFLVAGYVAVRTGLTNQKGVVDEQNSDFLNEEKLGMAATSTPEWARGEEWEVLTQAILKDRESIILAAEKVGVSPRLIVAALVPEQLRLFHDNRELFKSVFAPLQMLGNQNQFSLGVMGIKPETASEVEDHLKDVSSDFYPGKKYEHMLDFMTDNPGQERLERLTDEDNRYYSYLYAGLLLKQLESQWKKAGFDIADRPEILATLYNIGFTHSKPHAHPQSGGAAIEIRGKIYSFGWLAGEFYRSSELEKEFPK